jgi:N-acetylglucosaminyldiphosphoundecaprenol N-acetyl-beta-D-mannosaminyltransferase
MKCSPVVSAERSTANPIVTAGPAYAAADALSEALAAVVPNAVDVLGLKVAPWTLSQTLTKIDALLAAGGSHFFITANLNYAMLSAADRELQAINEQAAFLLADGMPLVWASRLNRTPLPGRVTGADLVPALAAHAARKGRRILLLGGRPGIARRAASNLRKAHVGLHVVGADCPELSTLTAAATQRLIARIRAARAQIVLVAFGQPKGERWLYANYRELGDVVAAQVGAAIDFAAGEVSRAPRCMQTLGIEWLYRFYLEPARLWRRYLANSCFLTRSLARGVRASLAAQSRRAAEAVRFSP